MRLHLDEELIGASELGDALVVLHRLTSPTQRLQVFLKFCLGSLREFLSVPKIFGRYFAKEFLVNIAFSTPQSEYFLVPLLQLLVRRDFGGETTRESFSEDLMLAPHRRAKL